MKKIEGFGGRVIARAFLCLIAAVIFAAVSSVCVFAEPSVDEDFYMIDDMSDASTWSSVTGTISFMRYAVDTGYLAYSEDDKGYISVRNYDMMSSESLEVSRAFGEPVDLFEYDEIGFYIFIADNRVPVGGTGAAGATGDPLQTVVTGYSVTVTLYSRGTVQPYSYSAGCAAGEWTMFTVPVGDFCMRTDVLGMSVSVSAETAAGADSNVSLSFRLDGIRTTRARDTQAEERFLSASFQSRGGKAVYADGCFTLEHVESGGRLIGYPVIRDRESVDADIIRFTLSETVRVTATLEITYLNGDIITVGPQTVEGGMTTALFFRIASVGEIYTYTLRVDGGETGVLKLYRVDLVTSAASVPQTFIGTAEACRILADGSVNLRGTVPAETVADNIGGSLYVYAVPVYGDTAEDIMESVPCAVTDMTTRFNIRISKEALPAGYEAMRFVTVIGNEKGGSDEYVPFESIDDIVVVSETAASFSEDTGVRLPAVSGSIKGLAGDVDLLGAGSAVTFIDVELSDLFGTANSGKLYSFGGVVYYFDNDCIASLDMKIRTPSLTGTSCFIRIRSKNGWGMDEMLTADGEDGFSTLYAAVDYLSSRYSSADYGFISGIALGEDISTDKYDGDGSPAGRAETLARAAAVAYRTGRANIAGFRVVLPIGSGIASADPRTDAADVLFYLGDALSDEGGIPCDLLIETAAGVGAADALTSFVASTGRAPSYGIYVVYRSDATGSAAEMLADYAVKYYDACRSADIDGFLLSYDADALTESEAKQFADGFRLLDTSAYSEVETLAGIGQGDDGSGRAHPITVSKGFYMNLPGNVAGSYDLFDFTESFSTFGWFSVSGSGECSTVRSEGMRELRADGACGGVMYSFASSPIDMTDSPVLRFDARSSDGGAYKLRVFSPLGVYEAELNLRTETSSYYFDISDFGGVSAVTGISLVPASSNTLSGSVYISRMSVFSRELDDEALRGKFETPAVTEGERREEKILPVTAVSLSALALGAGAVAVLGYRSRERETETEAYEQV